MSRTWRPQSCTKLPGSADCIDLSVAAMTAILQQGLLTIYTYGTCNMVYGTTA